MPVHASSEDFLTFWQPPVRTDMSVKHFNQTELAERWDITEATLERWRTEGIGPVFLKLQGRVLYRVEDIEAFEVASLRQSTSKRASRRKGE